MKLVATVLTRNEDWIIRACLEAALRWNDVVCVLDDESSDETGSICREVAAKYPGRVDYLRNVRSMTHWNEMDQRQILLERARANGATHISIVDSDEIMSANLDDKIRGEFERLSPGECLEVPMLAMRALDVYQDDGTVWSGAWLTLGFADAQHLTWKPAEDGYQHHSRPPRGSAFTRRYLKSKEEGGVFHLQFANRRRLLAKHWLYAYVDHLRWPGREDAKKTSWKYSLALEKPGHLGAVPFEWWENRDKKSIKLDGVPWQEEELRKMLAKHGEAAFAGIKLIQERPV